MKLALSNCCICSQEILALLLFLVGRGSATVLVTDPGMTRMVALSGERCDYYTDR